MTDSPDQRAPDAAELIKRQVAQDILRIANSSQDRGTLPGHWLRWADVILHPKVDWRRALAAAVRRAVEVAAGSVDYSFSRPSLLLPRPGPAHTTSRRRRRYVRLDVR